jgi:hypothetical protein
MNTTRQPRVFISVANRAHEAFRSILRDELTRTRFFDVVVQPDLAHTTTDTVRKLDRAIAPCDLLVHIVGSDPGSRANAEAVEDFFAHTSRDSFLAKHPKVKAMLGDFSHLTYFQWEPYLALHRGIDALVYAEPGHDKADFPQRDHLDTLYRTRDHADTLPDAERRCARIVVDVCAHFGIIPQALEQKIAPSRLVSRHTADDDLLHHGELLGRRDELALLDAAWNAEDTVNVQSIIAWGGVGKTALLAFWVQSRFTAKGWKNADGHPDPIFYFDWTFYDQGTRADDATHAGAGSIGTFFVEALRHFGDPDPDKPEQKAARLATLVQRHRSLIVLDGLEPLQHPFNHPQAGLITDPDLAQFLRSLAQKNPGLCLVSSREVLSDLKGSAAPHHSLDDLSEDAAVSLLRNLQVVGSEADLHCAARDYHGHALSLILLGRFLVIARGGDVCLRNTIKIEKLNDLRTAKTRNAWNILEQYEQWLSSPQGNPADLQALRLVGLFDRPASPDCLDALRRAAIPGLTDRLNSLDRDAWNVVLDRLNEAHLIQLRFPVMPLGHSAHPPEPCAVAVDAHPLIREYFAKRLKQTQPVEFADAHSRLFDHLIETTEFQPQSLEGLQPLYQAIRHGCQASRELEALEAVYQARILRGISDDGYFSSRILGAFSADLGALWNFFQTHWTQPLTRFDTAISAWLLNDAAFRLCVLGDLVGAHSPMKKSTAMAVAESSWKSAAVRSSNLSELEITLGKLSDAKLNGEMAVQYADRTKYPQQMAGKRTTAADAFHQMGDRIGAENLFREAEQILKTSMLVPVLFSQPGFRQLDLLLANPEIQAWAVAVRVARDSDGCDVLQLITSCDAASSQLSEARKLSAPRGRLLDDALDDIISARILLYRAQLMQENCNTQLLTCAVSKALESARLASDLTYLPLALLTKAFFYGTLGKNLEEAERLLEEAQQISVRGPMPLFLADVRLHRARLFGRLPKHERQAKFPNIDPKAELVEARRLIEKHGYWRRKEELEDAEAAAVNW